MKKYLLTLMVAMTFGCTTAPEKTMSTKENMKQLNEQGSPLNGMVKDYINTPNTNYVDLYYIDGELIKLITYDYDKNVIDDVEYENGKIINQKSSLNENDTFTYEKDEGSEIITIYDENGDMKTQQKINQYAVIEDITE